MARGRAELAQRWAEAFNDRDMKTLHDLTGPDFEFHPYLGTLIETTVYRGLEGLRSYFADSDAAWETIQGRFDEVREVDDERDIYVGELRGQGRASGLEVRLPVSWVAEWRVGKLIRLDAYLSKEQALEAVGLRE